MKHLLTPRLALALALSGAVIPFVIVGCGGGTIIGDQSFGLTPTTFTLPNGQIARITGTRKSSNTASGSLTISDAQVATKTTGQQNAVLAGVVFVPKAYSFTGTINNAGVFDIGGVLRTVGATTDAPFRLTGTLPTTTATSYQLTFDGGTPESGTIPPPAPTTTGGATTAGTTTAGGTTAGTTTAGTTTAGGTIAGTTTAGTTTAGGTTAGGTTSGTNDPAIGLLTFTGGAGYNGLTAPVTNGFTEGSFTREGGILDVRVVSIFNNQTRNVSFTVNGPGNVAQGRTYDVSTQFPGAFAGAGYTDGNNRWQASNVIGTGGTGSITVTALSANSVTLAINNVVTSTNGVQFPGDAKGTLTINGTATFNLKAR